MKQVLAIIATVTIYLGSVLLIDSAIAKDHHAGAEDHSESHQHKDADRMRGPKGKGKGKGRDPRRDHSPIRMLFGNLDLSDEQRDQVGSIMREQMEKGKNQREDFKSETKDRLAAVLTDEQLRRFEENSMRMERRKEHMKDMDRKKGKDGRKGYKKKGKHKPRPQHN
jgi:Spy/CpxP family protein refolding chaperone